MSLFIRPGSPLRNCEKTHWLTTRCMCGEIECVSRTIYNNHKPASSIYDRRQANGIDRQRNGELNRVNWPTTAHHCTFTPIYPYTLCNIYIVAHSHNMQTTHNLYKWLRITAFACASSKWGGGGGGCCTECCWICAPNICVLYYNSMQAWLSCTRVDGCGWRTSARMRGGYRGDADNSIIIGMPRILLAAIATAEFAVTKCKPALACVAWLANCSHVFVVFVWVFVWVRSVDASLVHSKNNNNDDDRQNVRSRNVSSRNAHTAYDVVCGTC